MKNFNNPFQRIPFLFLGLFIFFSCETPEETIITPDGNLLDVEYIGVRDPFSAKNFASLAGLDSIADSLQYNTDVYKITYKTLYKGSTVTASGIVCIPRVDFAMDLLSFQHGTIAAHAQAPSVDNGIGGTSFGNLQFLSCLGMVLIFPDQIGFGSSTNHFHPYYVDEPSARAVIDMVAAARQLVLENNKLLSGRLFLAGYSQGGYLTLSAHRQIQLEGAPFGFTHTASYAASGGYLIKNVQEYFFAQTTYPQPFYMAYVAMAYNDFYDWNKPLNLYFQEPYASKIPNLFDGSLDGNQINDSLTSVVANLLQPNFLNGIDSLPEYQHLVDAMEENSLVDFVPDKFLVLYHGDQDITVPYQSSIDAVSKFNSLGGGTNVVFVNLPGKTHSTGVMPFVQDFLKRMGLI